MKVLTPGLKTALALFCFVMLMPQPGNAIPAFARKFGVKCYTCHTIPPALNKNGYMFKRLGYRMPPDEMDGSKAAPKVSALDKDIRFSLTNSMALIMQASFTEDKTVADPGSVTSASPTTSCPSDTQQSASCSSFNLDEAALFDASTIPLTGFSYFAHYELYQDGQSDLEQGFGVYTGGRANSNYFVKVGEMHMQEGEGTRAAMFYNLFPDPSFTLSNVDPLNFSLDQHPVGVDVGYTHASNYFKNIFAVSAKVTNGLNADGSEIMSGSTKNAKDVWADADYWFGPDGGVTVMMYRGSKDQIQNAGASNEFTYRSDIWRAGVFANYLFFDKLDILGGYMRSEDDWEWQQTGPASHYIANGYRGEVDYYFKPGTAVMARYDRASEDIAPQPRMITQAWGIGGEQALTSLGNVVLRGTFNQEHDGDPVALVGTTDKLFKLDIRYMW
ncbi:MAG TPA: hypothetical protein VMU57_19870 [Edaphobacter sp.]|uniref:hypothetical protein n=1 Tax=Edaphobacter sp. TaxID=1934404 RepID=UPI002BC87811|nr:hypothetical protein [Edaphobacter sp.]HUZ97168.1 hypothetical protein [Edaphobacter sp.]